MPATLPKFLLVTPVWNDSVRLEHFGVELAKVLAVSGLNITWVIADDGSDTEEVVHLERLKEKFSQIYSDVLLHLHPERSFKGGAIYQSWQQFPDADYYAFVDADGAVSAVRRRDGRRPSRSRRRRRRGGPRPAARRARRSRRTRSARPAARLPRQVPDP